MTRMLGVKVITFFIGIIYLLLLSNLIYWLYFLGHYVFHYEVIEFKLFDFPHAHTIITICLVSILVILESFEKKYKKESNT